MALHHTTPTEIEKIITSLPNKTSYGHDRVSNKMLKSFNQAISQPLSQIFNKSIQEGKFPEQMKKAEVVPLYKEKDMDIVINYWPISLLITISKVLEKIVYRWVYSFLESNALLYQSQYGFRTKLNCEQSIMEMTARILQAKEDGLYSTSIFLDLSKAFDKLNHEMLLTKLERLGICGVANDWFASYLSRRSLVAKVTTSESHIVYSDSYQVTYGTAQRLCLGPLLFILFCNDIYQLSMYRHLILFADDTMMLNSHCNETYLEFMLTQDLAVLIDWFKANQLSVYLGKTVMMSFSPKNGRVQIKTVEFEIPLVTHFKFLGVFIDENLTWNYHTEYLHNKLISNKHLLSTSRNIPDTNCLMKIYY